MRKRHLLSLLTLSLVLTGCSLFSASPVYAASGKTYNTYLNKQVKHIDNLTYSPTLIFHGDKKENLTNKKVNDYFYDVLIEVDNDLNVSLDNAKVDLTTYLDSYVKTKFVPVIKLNDKNVNKFISYFKNTYTYLDMMVLSSSLIVLESLYKDESTHILGSVYDISSLSLFANQFDNWVYVKDANKVGCNTLLLNANDPNLSVAANYVSSMTKVSWAISDSSFSDAYVASSGCMGIISSDPERTLSVYENYSKAGRLSPQKLAAHRGITAYANENSLSSCLFASSEGASHIEIDLQVCKDEEIVLCHNSQTNYNSDKQGWYFVNLTYEQLTKATLNDYAATYKEKYAKLSSLIEQILYTDIIVICELKFDNGSSKAIDELKCIENFKRIVDSYPSFYGHFFAITFYAPLAEKMKELMPEIPVGYLGGATSGKEKDNGVTGWSKGGGHKSLTDYANKIKFLRYYNVSLDETYSETISAGKYYCNATCDFYMARGYLQNTWTYEDISHLNMKTNIATSNVVEKCRDVIKEFIIEGVTISKQEYNDGKIKVNTLNYNMWKKERECEIIKISENDSSFVVLYYQETINNVEYGLYSTPILITVQ